MQHSPAKQVMACSIAARWAPMMDWPLSVTEMQSRELFGHTPLVYFLPSPAVSGEALNWSQPHLDSNLRSMETSRLMQVINDVGSFNTQDVEQFVAEHKLSEYKQKYQIVAIMGPQSSGKSTLLNHLVCVCVCMCVSILQQTEVCSSEGF
jgi:hypothetical protein